MKSQWIRTITLTTIVLSLNACHRESVKTAEYFKEHPQEIQTEAKRCVDNIKQNKSIEKDKTCMTLSHLASEQCNHQMEMMGNAGFMGLNCDDSNQVLLLTAQGF